MFLGLALILGALLWARDIRRRNAPGARRFRGPWIMGGLGAGLFLFYLWLVSHGGFGA